MLTKSVHLKPKAVLFDLDGTLIDSAPDLAEAINLLLDTKDLPRMQLARLRTMAGAGARGMIGLALGLTPQDNGYPELAEQFFQHYLNLDNQRSHAFDGVDEMLALLSQQGLPWGIVTNKARRFTEPVVEAKPFLQAARTIISGDTTPFSKPHPEPLLEAARRMELVPSDCWYVGDDKRDIDAARAAGMVSVAASWGYVGEYPIETWDADYCIASPQALLSLWL